MHTGTDISSRTATAENFSTLPGSFSWPQVDPLPRLSRPSAEHVKMVKMQCLQLYGVRFDNEKLPLNDSLI
ncbi:hypothetical protein TNCV_3827631 [Trichonephila clavipes]|nr:hypothetical protein TNCV_3827631 [Trichonephila clavipes]